MLTYIIFLFLSKSYQTNQISCECSHILILGQCESSAKCLWNEYYEKCETNQQYYSQEIVSSYCSQFIEEDCIQNEKCAFHLGKCQEFTKCEELLKGKCIQSSFNCISNGQICIPKDECEEYQNQQTCENKNKNGKYCIWKKQNEIQKCFNVEECEDLPFTLTKDIECREQLITCTTKIQGGCTKQKDFCEMYTFGEQCYRTINQVDCFWEDSNQQCLEKKCSNKYLTTHEECQMFLTQCTTNEKHCIQKMLCQQYNTRSGCVQDSFGKVCIYFQNLCYLKNCSQAPEQVISMDQCQMFESQLEKCVPKKVGGCKILPNNCSQLETYDSCEIVGQLNGKHCIWRQEKQECKIKECIDAPLYYDHILCTNWLNQYECIGGLEEGCIENVDNCDKILNLKSCFQDKCKKKCIIENNLCMEEKCESFKYPFYDSPKKCEEKLNTCTYSIKNKSCIEKECFNLEEDQCKFDFQFNKCVIPNGCTHKKCESASMYLKTHSECQNWDIKCTVNIVQMLGIQYELGCITKYIECNQFNFESQCISSIQDIPCIWNQSINQCEFQNCNNAPISFITILQCQGWVKYHKQKCIPKQNGGCIEQQLQCSLLTDQMQCEIGSLNSLCFWNVTNKNCEDRTCENASTTLNTNVKCREWLKTCNLKLTGNGCKLDLEDYDLCTDAPETDQFSTREECQAWNPRCTLKYGSACVDKLSCDGYLTQAECVIDINNQPCFWNGTICTKTNCLNLTYPYFGLNCMWASQGFTCQNKQSNCSDYTNELECKVDLSGNKCIYNWSNNICFNIQTLAYSEQDCITDDKITGLNYYYSSNRCDSRPTNCTLITQSSVCEVVSTINNELCNWNNTQCSKLSNSSSSTIRCTQQNGISQYDCKKHSSSCEFDFIYGYGCTYVDCQYVPQKECKYITLNRNVQCFWNQSSCEIRTCANADLLLQSTYQCILWLNTCKNDDQNSKCINRGSCSDENTEFLCNQAAFINTSGKKVYCYWNNTTCSDIISCDQIPKQISISHDLCQEKLSDCTTVQVSINVAKPVEVPSFCGQIMDIYHCQRNSKFELCIWKNGRCYLKQCFEIVITNSFYLPGCYFQCSQQPFCIYNSQTQQCEEFTECQEIPNYEITDYNCYYFNMECRANDQLNKCIRNTKCSQSSTYSNCESFLPNRTCRWQFIEKGCQHLAPACSSYSQKNCKYDYKFWRCIWAVIDDGSGDSGCQPFSCNLIKSPVQTHQDCQLISTSCTISINTNGGSCIDLLECNQYLYEYQCYLNLRQQICSWIDNQCIYDNCRNAPYDIYNIEQCELNFGSNCTINEDRSGCIIKRKKCQDYNKFQCLTPNLKTFDGSICFWNQYNQICSEIFCDKAPKNYKQLIECESFNTNCQQQYCRKAECSDFKYNDDISCSKILANNKCTTDGIYCIERKLCENAINQLGCTYSINFIDCQWIIDENRCVIKSCNTAPLSIKDHFECQQYFEGCTAKQNGSCVEITTCNSIQTQEGCLYDQNKQACLWDSNINQCIYLSCKTLCGDGIVGFDEECDDGNIIPYDGCYKCKIQCQYGCDVCNQNICQECVYGYELNLSGVCIEICGDGIIVGKEQCDDMNNIEQDGCFQCQFQCHSQCHLCFQGICLECAYGWQQYNNQCISICGNGELVKEVEQCDDGNIENFDGCNSKCIIEQDWICTQSEITGMSECFNQIAPIIQLKNLSQQKDSLQIISLSFNQKVKLSKNLDFQNILKINITNNSSFDFTIEPIQNATEIPDNVEYLISIKLLEQIDNPQATIQFTQSLFINNYGQELSKLSETVKLGTPLILSQDAEKRLNSTIAFNEIMIYVFIGSSSLSVLTGNFDLFFNMLALLQQLSYVRYLNIPYPTHLSQYLKVFKIVSFQPLYDKLNIDYYYSQLNFGNSPFIQSKNTQKQNEEFNNAFFLVNAKSFYITMFTSFLLYLSSKIINKLIYFIFGKMSNMVQLDKQKKMYNVLKMIQQFSLKTCKYFVYSGLIKAFISTQYQLMYSAYNQFPEYQFTLQHRDLFSTFNSINALIAIILPHLFLYKSFVVLQKQYKVNSENKYSIFYEIVKQDYWSRLFIPISMMKVAFYMAVICFLFNSSIIQIITLIILWNIYCYYLIAVQPLKLKVEQTKLLIREILFLMIISSCFPYCLPFNDEITSIIGWLHIGLFSLIILQNIVLDLVKQFSDLALKYQQNKIKNQKQQEQQKKIQNSAQMFIVQDLQIKKKISSIQANQVELI